MPRNVSNIYSIPPGTEGIPDTTIESSRYNAFIHDVETDLNTPRPIVAGGTGENTAAEALQALGGEKATQAVTNYDTHAWLPGSFYSATTATAPPVAAHAFAGTSYTNGTDIVVEATDLTDADHHKWIRAKVGGVWSAWTDTTLDTTKVAKAGDTMTGDLTITKAQPKITLNKAASGEGNIFVGQKAGLDRWQLWMGDTSPEAGADAGSNFTLLYCSDAGAIIDVALVGVRSTGLLSVKGNPTAPLGIAPKQYVDNADSSVMSAVNASKVSKTGDVMSGPLNVGGTVQYNALISARIGSYGANFEWGHINTAGYGSVIGNDVSTGTPYIGFNCGPATDADRYKTLGQIGTLLKPISGGGVSIQYVPNANADNQSPFTIFNIQSSGYCAGPAVAGAPQFWFGGSGGQLLTTTSVWAAAGAQVLTDAAVITLNLASGINFYCSLGATGRTMGPPSNVKPGQSGVIWFANGVGGATITSWDSHFKFPGGVKPVMSTAGGAIDMLSYIVLGDGNLYCTFQNGFA